MADVKLSRPVAGQQLAVPSAPDARLILDFPANQVSIDRPEGYSDRWRSIARSVALYRPSLLVLSSAQTHGMVWETPKHLFFRPATTFRHRLQAVLVISLIPFAPLLRVEVHSASSRITFCFESNHILLRVESQPVSSQHILPCLGQSRCIA